MCVCVCVYMFEALCSTDAALGAGGIQPFASGKGRHDEVMLTVCNLRVKNLFNTILLLLF